MFRKIIKEGIGNSATQTGITKIDEVDKVPEKTPEKVEKKVERKETVVPAIQYKVGDQVVYKPQGGDYGKDTEGKVVNIMDNDVTVKLLNGKFLVWSKEEVQPKGKEETKKDEKVEESLKYLENLLTNGKF